MKRIITFLVIFASMCVAGPLIRTEASDEPGCSNASVQGSYGFVQNGTGPNGDLAGVGRFIADGNGSLSSAGTVANETTGVSRPSPATGTYTVNPDCTGSVDFGGGVTFDFVVVDGGNEIYTISTRSDLRVVTFVSKKQFPQRHGEAKD